MTNNSAIHGEKTVKGPVGSKIMTKKLTVSPKPVQQIQLVPVYRSDGEMCPAHSLKHHLTFGAKAGLGLFVTTVHHGERSLPNGALLVHVNIAGQSQTLHLRSNQSTRFLYPSSQSRRFRVARTESQRSKHYLANRSASPVAAANRITTTSLMLLATAHAHTADS